MIATSKLNNSVSDTTNKSQTQQRASSKAGAGMKRLRSYQATQPTVDDDGDAGGDESTEEQQEQPQQQTQQQRKGTSNRVLLSTADAKKILGKKFSDQKKVFREVFTVAGHGAARHYRVAQGYVLSEYKMQGEKLVRDGTETWFDAQGHMIRKRTWLNGKCHGTDITWCFLVENRVIAKVEETHKAETNKAEKKKEEEKKKVWVDAGRAVVCERTYVNGALSGQVLRYDVAPAVEIVAGVWRYVTGRYVTAKTATQTNYVGGVLEGNEVRYYTADPSKVLHQCTWSAGLKVGREIYKFSNGKTAYEATYVDGVVQRATIKRWYRNGTLRTETKMHGVVFTTKTVSKQGFPLREANSTMAGVKQGTETWWEGKVAVGDKQIDEWHWAAGKRVQKNGALFVWAKKAKRAKTATK